MRREDCTIGTRILSKHDGDWHPGVVKSTINDDGMFWVTIEFEGGYKSWGLRFASELRREGDAIPGIDDDARQSVDWNKLGDDLGLPPVKEGVPA